MAHYSSLVVVTDEGVIVVDPNPDGADGGADLHIAAPAGEAVPRLLQDMQLTSIRA